MQNFWGVKEVHYGIVQVVNSTKKKTQRGASLVRMNPS